MQRDLGRFGSWVSITNQQDFPEAVENAQELSLLLSKQLYILSHTSPECAWKHKGLKMVSRGLWLQPEWQRATPSVPR